MIVLGVVPMLIGFIAKIAILWSVGIVVAVVGLILMLLGMAGRETDRRHYCLRSADPEEASRPARRRGNCAEHGYTPNRFAMALPPDGSALSSTKGESGDPYDGKHDCRNPQQVNCESRSKKNQHQKR